MTTFGAVSTSAFLDSVGVNTTLDETETTCANAAEVESELSYLGVKNVRDTMASPNDGPLYQAVAAATGVKFDIFLSYSALNFDRQIAEMAQNTSIIKFVEGTNEADTWPITYDGLTGFAAIAAVQQSLYTMATTLAAGSGIGVIGPSYGQQSSFSQAANTAATSNYGNTHEYWGTGNPPGADIAGMIGKAQLVSGSNPIIATEAGYYTGPSLEGTGPYAAAGVDELVQAKYDLTILFDNWQAGIQNTYLYDLMDRQADPNNTNYTDHYGLFNADGTPKIAATALHNLFAVLGGDTGNTTTPTTTLGYQVTGMPVTGSSMLMENPSGVFDIAMWNNVRLWSATSPTEIANPAVPITLNFGQTVQSVTEYDPLTGTTAIQSWSNVQTISLGLVDHPIILAVTPYAAGPLSLTTYVEPETVAAGQSGGNLWSAIIGNAVEADPNALSGVTIGSVGTAHTSGSVAFNAANQSLVYTAPSYNPFNPTDSFTYTLDDGQGNRVTGTVAITETPPADTLYGTLAGAGLRAPASGWTLDSMSTGESVFDSASGGDTLVAASDTTVYANGANDTIRMGNGNHILDAHGCNEIVSFGNGNNTIALSGSGYTITAGNGNNLVWKATGSTSITMGNGNQTITLEGLHNTVALGAGASSVNVGTDGNAAGYEKVAVNSGSNQINVGGASDTVVVGGGTNRITANGSSARLMIYGGQNTISALGGANVVDLVAGTSLVNLAGNNNFVCSSNGIGTINANGTGDRIYLGAGDNTVNEHGSNDHFSFGDGNNIIGVSGTGYTISTGNGNNVVWKALGSTRITMGDGNQTITVGGLNNTISLGTGTSVINAGNDGNAAGYEHVTVAGGTNSINVGGASDIIQVGGGTNNSVVAEGGTATITVLGGSGNSIVAGYGGNTVELLAGTNTVAVSGNANVITGGSGADSIWAGGNADIITAGSGTESITSVGQGDVIDLTNGNDTLTERGSQNTIILPAGAAVQIYGNVIAAGDVFDLRTALSATTWSGSIATLSNYLLVSDVGRTSIISVAAGGSGAGQEIAVLNNTPNLTYQALVAQAIFPAQASTSALAAPGNINLKAEAEASGRSVNTHVSFGPILAPAAADIFSPRITDHTTQGGMIAPDVLLHSPPAIVLAGHIG